ncbi:ankyrin repeat protein [Xylogone sp. PMI_703]|nr:ankyrin repeat protein [Xylogone sp. PMI_703]
MSNPNPSADGSSRLFNAIVHSDIGAIKDVLSSGVDVESRDAFGRTALQLAILSASVEVVKCLLDHGAAVDSWTKQGEATLHLVASRGDVAILHLVMRAHLDSQQTGGDGKQSFNVDCLDKKRGFTPLHIATGFAHVDFVGALLHDYGANCNIPIKTNPRSPMSGIGTLYLALQHPRDSCRALIKLLFQHGASLIDKETGKASLLIIRVILLRELDVIDILQELESSGLSRVISKTLWKTSMVCNSLLTLAIRSGLEDVAMMLLELGAPYQVTFDSTLDYDIDFHFPGKTPLEIAQNWFWQPILVAAEYEMPKLVIKLIDLGADIHVSLDEEQAREMIGHSGCRTLLDIVSIKLAEFRAWHIEDEHISRESKEKDEEAKQLIGKQNAINQLIKEYEEVETRVTSMGGKLTEGLDLQAPEEERQDRKRRQFVFNRTNEIPLESLDISGAADSDTRNLQTLEQGFAALSTACKENDTQTVKALTLASWGTGSKFPPIAIAEKRTQNQTPYLTAVLHCHYDLARTIVLIAAAQHAKFSPLDHVVGQDVLSSLADDKYSPESLKALSGTVKCAVSPKNVVVDYNVLFEVEKKRNMEMFQFILDVQSSFPVEQNDINWSTRHAWHLVERGDWPDALDKYIRATGAPFKHAAIHGKLSVRNQLDKEFQMAPTLHAARSGNLHTVKYFLEPEKALDAYKEFASKNEYDLRKGDVEKAKQQFLDAVSTWLNKRSNLALHSSVVSWNKELIQFLVSTRPDLLNIKSIDGWTPLLVAVSIKRYEFIEILIDGGADMLATDNQQRNMLHLLLAGPCGAGLDEAEKTCAFIRSLDTSIRTQLFQQQCTEVPGGTTPLARWLYCLKQIEFIAPEPDELFKTVLEFSDTSIMEALDAIGNTPLHIVTKHSLHKIVLPVAEKAPQVLFIEGAAGKTPIDLVREEYLNDILNGTTSRYARGKVTHFSRAGQILLVPPFAFSPSYQQQQLLRDAYEAWDVVRAFVDQEKPSYPRRLVTKEQNDSFSESSKKKKPKQPKGNDSDEISLAIYRPGNLY